MLGRFWTAESKDNSLERFESTSTAPLASASAAPFTAQAQAQAQSRALVTGSDVLQHGLPRGSSLDVPSTTSIIHHDLGPASQSAPTPQ